MSKADVLIPIARDIQYDWMQMIVDRSKTYEFRKARYPTSVVRIWFYQTAPISSLSYICEVDPGLARDPSNPLPLNGHGNKEFNEGIQPNWTGPMHAYRVKSCYKVRKPIPLWELKEKYGFGGAPRGMVYVTEKMREDIQWDKQELMWTEATEMQRPKPAAVESLTERLHPPHDDSDLD